MWHILTRALRTGTLTMPLAALEAAAPPATRGRPALTLELCDGNATCEQACPTGALRLGPLQPGPPANGSAQRAWRLDYGACLFCGRCADVCKAGALRLTTEDSLSTLTREDLIFEATVTVPRLILREAP